MKSLLFIIVFTLLGISRASAQTYPIFITDEGHIVIEVTLNGSKNANFILDTAAGATVLSSKTFKKIEQSAESIGFFTGFRHDGDRIDGEIFKIPSISIGNISQKNVLVGVYPPLDDYGVDGLISLKFFEDNPFAIDFKNRTIQFYTTSTIPKNIDIQVPIQLKKHRDISLDMFIPIRLNDKLTVQAEFDTGSGYNVFLVNPHFIEALDLDITHAEISTYTTPISQNELKDTNLALNSVQVGNSQSPIISKNITATFREGLIYEALIGSSLFSDKKILIDIPNKTFSILK